MKIRKFTHITLPLVLLGAASGLQAQGGVFSEDKSEINVFVGQEVVVTGEILVNGETFTHLTVPVMRLPLLQADLQGNPLPGAQPSMAVASISAGLVTAVWTPEFTGTYAITESGVNIRIPGGQKLRFPGLQVFVLPQVPPAQ